MKPLSWFQEREGEYALCIFPDEKTSRVLTITDPKHYFQMQERGYRFMEKV
jgi:hypothetical protein